MKLSKKLTTENDNITCEQMRARRKELDMTQSEVAKAVGCSTQQIQKYETGASQMSLPVLCKVCQALRTHPARFFTSFTFAESQDGDDKDKDLEARLLMAFKSVDNKKIKERIVNLVEALISTSKV